MTIALQKVVDSQKRLVLKIVGNGGQTTVQIVDAGGLNFSLNANGQLLGTGSDRLAAYGLALKRVLYDTTANPIIITTDGTGANGNTFIALSGSGDLRFDEGGDSLTLNTLALTANTTGNLFLQTANTTAAASAYYTVVLDFRKNPKQYDPGQFADPAAFNQGNYGYHKFSQ